MLLAFALAFQASAQITIKGKTETKLIATLATQWNWLYQIDDTYILCIKSDNQFDDSYDLILGKTRNECLESLSALMEFCTLPVGETYEIENGGRTFSVGRHSLMGEKSMSIFGSGHAGHGIVNLQALKKAVKYFNGLKE